MLLDLQFVSLGDDRMSPASPLGFDEFLLPVPVFGFCGETGAGETLPHRIPTVGSDAWPDMAYVADWPILRPRRCWGVGAGT
ncbi:hypothetical protein ACIGT4_04090 [Streptomyces sioyaensis]|uniref:hypothetical protein n=1 Tax=Streptomyces sioyaensis TaxID=67364 RepID=UPI0037CF494B